MNPLLRWVKKVIQFFRPAAEPAAAVAARQAAFQPATRTAEKTAPKEPEPVAPQKVAADVPSAVPGPAPVKKASSEEAKAEPISKPADPLPIIAEPEKISPAKEPEPPLETIPPTDPKPAKVEEVIREKPVETPSTAPVAAEAPAPSEKIVTAPAPAITQPVKMEEIAWPQSFSKPLSFAPAISALTTEEIGSLLVGMDRAPLEVAALISSVMEEPVVVAESIPEKSTDTSVPPELEAPTSTPEETPVIPKEIEAVAHTESETPAPEEVESLETEVESPLPVKPEISAPAPAEAKDALEVEPEPIPLPTPVIATSPVPLPVVEDKQPEPKRPIFTGRVELTPGLDNPARLRQIKGVISVQDITNRELLDLVPYEPGKPVDDVARELGLDPKSIIKLASNENPLGPSPLAVAAMHDAIDTVHFYPDGGGFHLRNAIATKFGLGRENVVLGNGSNEIIELLFHTFTRPGIHEIVTARHAFAVYTLMAQLFGVHAITVDDVDFTPDLPAMLKAITPQTRLVFLASPNNPTGTRVSNEALDQFLRDLPPHVIAVLDEAYYEFLDNPPDTVGHVKAGDRVVLMRTFSKIQGLAGLRIGYGLAPAEIANLLQRARQPFNANLIAQAGAMAGLADTEHQNKTKAITDEGRVKIEAAFAKMGLKYIPSSANFVLVHVGDGGEVFKRLMKKGIIVRSMVSYHLPEYIRVSIGTPEQNDRFLAELPGALEGLVQIDSL